MNISELSCTNKYGKPIYGTAAIIHRLFKPEESVTPEQLQSEMREYERIIYESGYAYPDNSYNMR